MYPQSRKESEMFADQKDDPTSGLYALEFLRKHPEVQAESVSWHTHDLVGTPASAAKGSTPTHGSE
jgi:hypothetical protein